MSEQQGDPTNVWTGASQAPQSPTPPTPRDPRHDQTSASERAFSEGWPAQPGWAPERGPGPEWGAPPQQYGPQQYGQQYQQPPGQPWVPSQTAYSGTPPYGTPQHPYPGGGYPPAGAAPYPGPDAPLPQRNTGMIIGSVLGVVLLVAAAIGGIVFFTRNSGSTTKTAATASAPPPGGTGSTNAGGQTQNSTGSGTGSTGSKSGSGSSGTTSHGSSSGKTSTTAPMTGSTSIDLTTVHVPAYLASPDANDVAHTLDAYFTGINSGNYQTAWDQLTSSMQAKNPFSQFSDNTSGTIDQDVNVTALNVRGDGSASTSVTFTSTQPPDKGVVAGQTCTDWAITYSMQLGDGAGGWLIAGTPSAQHSAC